MVRVIRREQNSFYLLVLLAFFLLFSYQVQAEVRCEKRILSALSSPISSAEDLLNSIQDLPPYWNRPGTRKLFTRYWEVTEVLTFASEILKLPHEIECLELNEQSYVCFDATLFERTKKLSISIPVVAVGEDVNMGLRPKNLNMEFLKILTGLLRGVETLRSQGAAIETLEISGVATMNPSLAVLLVRMGLEPMGVPSFVDSDTYRIKLNFK